jgi:hypothetical protein
MVDSWTLISWVSRMVIKYKKNSTPRVLIEAKRKELIDGLNNYEWEPLKKQRMVSMYGKEFILPTETVYARMKLFITPSDSILDVKIYCELCSKFFLLDEEFMYVGLDRGYHDILSCHKECLIKLSDLDERS